MKLVGLADKARELDVDPRMLLRQVKAAEKSLRVKIVVQHKRGSKIWLNATTLERMKTRAEKDLAQRVGRLEGGFSALDERLEAVESRFRP